MSHPDRHAQIGVSSAASGPPPPSPTFKTTIGEVLKTLTHKKLPPKVHHKKLSRTKMLSLRKKMSDL